MSASPASNPETTDPTPDFVLERELAVPVPAVRTFLCDLHHYVPLHPFIESIQDLAPSETLPNARRYRVVDRIPLGPFKLKTVYVAAVEPVGSSEVRGHAWQSPGIRLETRYLLSPTASGTRLEEHCRVVTAPWGLRGFVVRQARKAHDETLDGLKALLESRPLSELVGVGDPL